MSRARILAVALAIGALAGCAGPGGGDAPRGFDFGIDPPAARLAQIRIGPVRATAPFDSQEMHYRLMFRDPAELRVFAQSRWAAPPAELVRRQLGRSAQSEATGRCALEVELNELSQLFGSREASEVLLELRVFLHEGGRRIAERTLRVVERGAGAGAPGGAAAAARAADRAIGEIAGWVAREARCATP